MHLTFFILGLFLIWLGGFISGCAIGTAAVAPRRVKTSDLYPPKGPNDAA